MKRSASYNSSTNTNQTNNNAANNNDEEADINNEFNQLLDKLTLSRHSIENTALFALKNKNFEKLIFFSILKKIEQAAESNKLNYLFLLDSICQQIKKSNLAQEPYLPLIEVQLEFILLKVLPEENPLEQNLVGIRKVLNNWKLKKIFNLEKLKELETKLGNNKKLSNSGSGKSKSTNLKRSEIMRKVEQHRENHKFIKRSNWLQKSEFHQRKEFDQLMETIGDWDHDVDIPKLIYHNQLFLNETTRSNMQ